MRHFTTKERIKLGNYLRFGFSYRKISKLIGKAISSISEEINRNGGKERYTYYEADTRAVIKKQQRKKRLKLEKSPGLKKYVIKRLQDDLSPEQVSGELRVLARGKSVVSHETIYQFIYSKEGEYLKLWKHLRHRRKYTHPKRRKWGTRRRRNPIPSRISIHNRPSEIEKNIFGEIESFGHWEADLMVFSKSPSVLAVFVERKTKQTFSFVNDNKTSAQMKLALHAFIEQAGLKNIKTITFDNGLENVCHEEVRKEHNYSFDTYFCDPYSSWQKGLVENTNKLIRQYFPKRFEHSLINQDNLDSVLEILNSRPRKLLGFLPPFSVFNSCSL